MPIPQEVLEKLGFENNAEWARMVAAVDLSTREKLRAFELWKKNDGTKKGLEPLLEVQDEAAKLYEFADQVEQLARDVRAAADALAAGYGDKEEITKALDQKLKELFP